MRAPEADSAGQADHSTLVRMNGLHGQEFHFFTCFAPLLVHLNIIPRPAKNLRQAASTDSRVLVEIGLSGISSLCVFWRIRIASVELIDSRHREGPIVLAFITAIWCNALAALPGARFRKSEMLWKHSKQRSKLERDSARLVESVAKNARAWLFEGLSRACCFRPPAVRKRALA